MLYQYFWDDNKDIQNIYAFSIYDIVEHTLFIVHNVILQLQSIY